MRAGDPKGEVTTAWHAKEAVREPYNRANEALARAWIDRLIEDMADTDNPIEVRSLGGTLKRWKEQIVAWHRSHVTNGPTEAANNLQRPRQETGRQRTELRRRPSATAKNATDLHV